MLDSFPRRTVGMHIKIGEAPQEDRYARVDMDVFLRFMR
jgi:hypothetical protein